MNAAMSGALCEIAERLSQEQAVLRDQQRRVPLVPDGVMLQSAIDRMAAVEKELRARAAVIANTGLKFVVTYVRPERQSASA